MKLSTVKKMAAVGATSLTLSYITLGLLEVGFLGKDFSTYLSGFLAAIGFLIIIFMVIFPVLVSIFLGKKDGFNNINEKVCEYVPWVGFFVIQKDKNNE